MKLSDLEKSEEWHGMPRSFDDLTIMVENPAGTSRYGIDNDGNEWRTNMIYDYGYIPITKGVDGDCIDVYVGPDHQPESVFVVHQNRPDTGEYDEDKVMIGFANQSSAKESYLKHYDNNKFFGGMTTIPYDEFRKAIKDNKRVINFKKYSSKGNKSNEQN